MISEAYRTLQDGGVCAISTTFKFDVINPLKYFLEAVVNIGRADALEKAHR